MAHRWPAVKLRRAFAALLYVLGAYMLLESEPRLMSVGEDLAAAVAGRVRAACHPADTAPRNT